MTKNDVKNLLIYFIPLITVFSLSIYIINSINVLVGFLISVLLFGRLQIHLSEILHEATHFNLIRSSKKFNDLFSDIFVTPFLLIRVSQNRISHFKHHSFKDNNSFFTHEDPETVIFHPTNFSLKNILKDLLGINQIKLIISKSFISSKKNDKKYSKSFKHLITVFYIMIVWLIFLLIVNNSTLVIISYFIAAISVYPFLNRVRIYLMHKEVNGTDLGRNLKSDLISNIFISDLMLNHGLHHEQPSLSFRKLNELSLERITPKEKAIDVLKRF